MMLPHDCAAPYVGYRVYYGFDKKHNRWLVQIIHKVTKERRTLQLARFTWEIWKGEKLASDMEVYHIDGDRLNWSCSNLAVRPLYTRGRRR